MPTRTAILVAASVTLFASACVLSPDRGREPLVPLAVGNEWTYSVLPLLAPPEQELVMTYDPIDLVIEGTTVFEGETWRDAGVYLWRQTRDGVALRWAGDPGYFFFKYPVDDGESYTFSAPHDDRTFVVRVTRRTVHVPAGTFSTYCYSVDPDAPFYPTTDFDFVPGIGLVRKGDWGFVTELASYRLQ